MQRKVFLGIGPQKYQKKAGRKSTRYISTLRRENLSLTGCSSAEPVSVSVQPCKSHLILLYLQLVKKDSHLPSLAYNVLGYVHVADLSNQEVPRGTTDAEKSAGQTGYETRYCI